MKIKRPLSLPQKAGILCSDKLFHEWGLFENASEAAIFLRRKCGITSRSELSVNITAIAKYNILVDEFETWKLENQYADNIERM